MANYLIAISGHSGSDWQIKGTAVACYSMATLGKLLSAHHFVRDCHTNNLQYWCLTRNTHIGSQMLLEL